MVRSRIIVTGDGTGVRARLLPDACGAQVIELTQLERHRDGYMAERARSFVPVEAVDDLVSALRSLCAASLLKQAPTVRRPRAKPKPAANPNQAYRRFRAEDF